MKKGIALIVCVGMLLTSCGEEKDTTNSFTIPCVNLITSDDDSEAPKVEAAYYSYEFNISKNHVYFALSSLSLGSSTTGISLQGLPYTSNYYTYDGSMHEVIQIKSENPGNALNGMAIKNFDCEMTSIMYTPPTTIDDIPTTTPSYKATVMEYEVGDHYKVRTFWPDASFRGTTVTTVAGDEDSAFTSSDICYRFKMDLDSNTATMVIYDAKFNSQMPSISALVLRDLTLTFTNDGYTISGENVIPESYEAGSFTPYPGFPFNSVKFEVSGHLTTGRLSFEVSGRYQGQFTGAYVVALKDIVNAN